MLVHKKQNYSSKRKYVQGRGFVDSLSSTIRNVGSYIAQNKDLIAKPLLGAVGDLAAFGVTEAGKSVISHIINKNINKNRKSKSDSVDSILSPKANEILQKLMTNTDQQSVPVSIPVSVPVENIMGSGIKQFKY